ncbi:MAG: methylated-DNA--[protein]-cysteine S-methyltransferase [Saprospiraceae bacterium]|nr:methylated-DNA--[protein]-cysteine S-methyltransferase [Saprospiraceae bacterium]MBP7699470.1 methylated-DNA--[protein]-cysteine S-methyltransferase [Saprospiraceae bacterium]
MYIDIQYYKSPFGELVLGSYEQQLCLCDWRYRRMRTAIDTRIQKLTGATYREMPNSIHQKTINQLEEFAQGERTTFDIPLCFVGSTFQQNVWQQLLKIPFGKTISYLQLSQQFGDEKAIRAVAMANGANALSIIVPCHRVIGSKGDLVGYAGGLAVKKQLLLLENATTTSNQFSLF